MTNYMKGDYVKIKVSQVAYHRNGVGGEGFYAIRFNDPEQGDMVASVFDGEGRVAVYNIDLLKTDGVTFGVNSWRGDHYESALRKAIKEHEEGGKYAAGSVRVGPFSIPTDHKHK